MNAGFSARQFSARHIMAGLIAIAVLGIAQPAAPQTASPRPSPAAMQLARQIVDVKGVKAMFDPMVRGVVQKVKDMFMQTNFMWSKDLNEVAVIVQKDYDPRLSELIDETARIYASHFTEAELKDILAFYQSPLGRKMTVEEPKALDESMANAGTWGDKLSEEVVTKMRIEMKKRGHDL
jgi:uncharacterized protein